MDYGEEAIHVFWHFAEVWRNVVSHVDGLQPIATAKLSDVRYSRSVQ